MPEMVGKFAELVENYIRLISFKATAFIINFFNIGFSARCTDDIFRMFDPTI